MRSSAAAGPGEVAASPPAPEVAVGGVAVVDGRLLLVQRANAPQAGRWTVPGGRVQPGETLATAVEREFLEETGVVAQCGPLLGWVERIGPDHHFVILDFVVDVSRGAPAPMAGDDAAAVAWVSLTDVGEVALVDGLEEFLRVHGILD